MSIVSQISRPRRALAAGSFAWLVMAALGQLAQAQHTPAWKTGPALRQQLAASASVTWEERPLREALGSVQERFGIATWLDRRIDPDQPITLSMRNQPLESLLSELAEKAGGEIGFVGNVAYLGPPGAAEAVATVAAIKRQQASQRPGEAKGRLLAQRAAQWPELAEPRALLATLAEEAAVEVVNPELVPHDLWAARTLPSAPLTDRLSLLLGGFGLTFDISRDARAIRLAALPEDAKLTKTYAPRGTAGTSAADIRKLAPGADVRIEKGQLVISASSSDHTRIERLLAGERVTTTQKSAGQQVYTMTVENQPAGAVLRTVATQLGKELKYDAAALAKLKQNVTLSVTDAPLETLLDKTLTPLGLTYKLDGNNLEIVATP